MFRKFMFGVITVALVIAIAKSGYEFGRYLAKQQKAVPTATETEQLPG